jgi:hypothetical protein
MCQYLDGVSGYGRAKANYHWLVYPVFLNPSHKNFCIARGQDQDYVNIPYHGVFVKYTYTDV